jgi:sugar transferase (PEP-CTERM system associated)
MARIGAQKIPPTTLLLLFLDAFFIVVGLLVAIFLRFYNEQETVAYLRGPYVAARFGLVIVVCETALYYCKLYDQPDLASRLKVFTGLLRALGFSSLVLALVYYLSEAVSLGRGIAAMSAPTIFALMLGSRTLLGKSSWFLLPQRVLVVGTGQTGISAVREILGRPELNLKVEGFLDEKGENIGKSLINPAIIGSLEEVELIALARRVNRIIISLIERRGLMPVPQLLRLKFAGVGVEDAHSFIEQITGRIHLEDLSPSFLILSDGFRISVLLRAAKRISDIVVGIVALVVFLPIAGLVAIAIWLESGGPIFFRQERTGLNGRTFRILKFRSMHKNAEAHGPAWAVRDDNRVTRVGRILRKFRLDELPQLLNVLGGEMSLVGPRPERPQFCHLLEQRIPYFALRNTVRPGLTGWAQVKYQYGGSIEESKTKLEYDLFYIKHISLALDLIILLETAKVVIYGHGAK